MPPIVTLNPIYSVPNGLTNLPVWTLVFATSLIKPISPSSRLRSASIFLELRVSFQPLTQDL